MNKFAPPTEEELQKFAPPTSPFAPPSQEELQKFAPPDAATGQEGGLFTGADITKEELAEIGKRHGVDPKFLQEAAPLYGAQVEGDKGLRQDIRYGLGVVSEALGGLPTWLGKKLEDENTRKALDEINELAQKKKSYAQAGLELAGGLLIPGVSLPRAGRLAATAAGAATGAVTALGETKEGEELEGAALGGILGGGFGALFGKAAKANPEAAKLSQKVGIKTDELNLGDNLTAKLDEYVEQKRDELRKSFDAIKSTAVEGKPINLDAFTNETEMVNFANWLTGKTFKQNGSAANALEKEFAKLTADKKDVLFEDFIRFKQIEKAKELLPERVGQVAPSLFAPIKEFFLKLSDGSTAGRLIDLKNGTQVQQAQQRLSRNQNKLTMYLHDDVTKIQSAQDIAQREKLASEEGNELLYKALDGDKAAKAKLENTETYKTFRAITDAQLDRIRKLGLNVQRREDYIPHYTLPYREFVDKMTKMDEAIDYKAAAPVIDRLLENWQETLTKRIKGSLDEPTTELVDFLQGLAIANGKVARSVEEFLDQTSVLKNPGAFAAKYTSEASALMQRDGFIPPVLRDRNVNRLLLRWGQGNYKAALFRQGLEDLRAAQEIAALNGDVIGARYLDTLRQDIVGAREGTFTTLMSRVQRDMETKYEDAATNAKSPIKKLFYKTIMNSPETMLKLHGNMYPAFLGLSPRAIVQNLTQPITMTIPELGLNGYGMGKVAKSYMNLAKLLVRGKEVANDPALLQSSKAHVFTRNPKRFNELMGMMQKQASSELQAMYGTLQEVASKQGVPKKLSRATEKMQEALMWGFEQSEALNRFVTLDIAAELGQDLFNPKNRIKALATINKFPASVRAKVRRHMRAGDETAVIETLEDYLVDRTMFNYNRANMSQIGRTLGPFMSSFTKWPATLTGNAILGFKERGAVGGTIEFAKRFGAPLGILMAMQYGLDQAGVDPDKDEMARFFLGKDGLTKAAPHQNLVSVFTGDIGPPAADLLTAPVRAASKGDAEGVAKEAFDLISAYTPGSAIWRTIFDLSEAMNQEPTRTSRERRESLRER